jgi:dienelactone hydrolase
MEKKEESMKRILIAMCFVLACATTPQTVVQSQEVTYRAGDTVLKGYLAYDDSIQGRRPGILVVHEWWGHNAYARKRARMLAELGYTALAVDMYGEGKQAAHPGDAGKFASEVKQNLPLAKERFMAAMELLKQQPTVDSTHIAAIGYCFGGGIVLEMARAGLDLDGVVSFHGSLGTTNPARSGVVKAKVLVLNGADDPFVKPEHITGFKQEMDTAGVSYLFVNYPGVKHSFTNPDADSFGQRAVHAPFGLRPGGRYPVLAGNAGILRGTF